MLIAYCDDSGEAGVQILAFVVLQDQDWLRVFDAWWDYRRWLRQEFGLRMSKGTGRRVPVELHATDMASGSGDWRKLGVSRPARMRALRVGLGMIGRHVKVFAVAWDPGRPMTDDYTVSFHQSPVRDCWRTALERLASHSHYDHGDDRFLTVIDQGYEHQFTKASRKMRRAHWVGSTRGGSLSASAPMLVDDPVVRDSRNSAFVQMADLCAYGALRELRPMDQGRSDLWTHLGQGILTRVNYLQVTEVPGIKMLPPR